jgi:cytochrome c-type biogenesis protein CcmH/NrfG
VPQAPRWRRVTVAIAVTAFAVTTCAVLARVLGERLEGETVTGNAQNDPTARRAALVAARDQNPLEAGPHLALARFLLQDQDLTGAVQEFDEAFRLDGTSAEAAAYGGWIRALAAGRVADPAQRAELYEAALERLNLAVAADPGYVDAHFFRGMAQCGLGRTEAAIADWQRYLELAGPETGFGPQIQGLIDDPPCDAPGAPVGPTPTTAAVSPTSSAPASPITAAPPTTAASPPTAAVAATSAAATATSAATGPTGP